MAASRFDAVGNLRTQGGGAARTAPQCRVIDAFVAACTSCEIEALLPLLDPSVAGRADVGGMVPAVSRPYVGREEVAQGVMRLLSAAAGTTLVARNVNGEPGVIALRGGAASAVLSFTVTKVWITRIYAVVDPPKLRQVERAPRRGR